MAKRIVVIVIGALLLVLLRYCVNDYLTIDRCLDQGGRWNAETRLCEYALNG